MNVIRLYGGLGNQMFQYAFGKIMSQNGIDVAYDESWFNLRTVKGDFSRVLRLDKFHVSSLGLHKLINSNQIIRENRAGHSKNLFKLRDCNFDGYWQYLDYYEDYISMLRQEFKVLSNFYTEDYHAYKNLIVNSKSIGVHVRRGDYLTQSSWPVTKLDYYMQAIKKIQGDLFIFSDDIPWCKTVFIDDYFDRKIVFIDLEDYLCLELLKQCSHIVMPDSTFSWWAAFLNENPDKQVIVPERWLGMDMKDLIYPKEWIKLKTRT